MNEFQTTYLAIIAESNKNLVQESFGKSLASAAIAGGCLLGSLNADGKDINSSTNKSFLNNQINNSSKQKVEKTAQSNIIQLSKDELFIAKTIYSEASTLCTFEEHVAIGKVIQNRIGHKGFGMGKLKTSYQVCSQPKAFTSVLKHNSNWDAYKIYLNKFSLYDAKIAQILTNPKLRLGGPAWMNDIVYYHDKSIKKPSDWDNKYWKAILVKETGRFKFYKVVENKKPIKRIKRIKRK